MIDKSESRALEREGDCPAARADLPFECHWSDVLGGRPDQVLERWSKMWSTLEAGCNTVSVQVKGISKLGDAMRDVVRVLKTAVPESCYYGTHSLRI